MADIGVAGGGGGARCLDCNCWRTLSAAGTVHCACHQSEEGARMALERALSA